MLGVIATPTVYTAGLVEYASPLGATNAALTVTVIVADVLPAELVAVRV